VVWVVPFRFGYRMCLNLDRIPSLLGVDRSRVGADRLVRDGQTRVYAASSLVIADVVWITLQKDFMSCSGKGGDCSSAPATVWGKLPHSAIYRLVADM